MRSARPNWLTAATESPPPTTVVPLQSATAFATSSVPLANSGNSKTPMGPFQITVFALRIRSRKSATDFGPMSMAILPSGTSTPSTSSAFAVSENSEATLVIDRQKDLRAGLLRLFQERGRRAA